MADPERQSLINKDEPTSASYTSFPTEGNENPGGSAVANNEEGT